MTKSPENVSRKRKPGGGRKANGPFGAKSSSFTARITAELKRDLYAEALSSGQSMSQIAELMMRIGLVATREGLVIHRPASIELVNNPKK